MPSRQNPARASPGQGRARPTDTDIGYAAGDVDGDYLHRFYAREDHSFSAWLHQRWVEEFEAWRNNNPTGRPEVAPPQAVMTHAPLEEALRGPPRGHEGEV